MENYRQMLKQALLNTASCNAIARSRGMSHNTVRRAKRLAEDAGLKPEDIDHMTDTELRDVLYPKSRKTNYVHPDYDVELGYLEEGYSLQEAHARYQEEVGISAAIGYSAYCRKIAAFKKTLEVEFRHVHQPGYSMQIDYGGKPPYYLENDASRKAQLFVATMPASGCMFAIATRTQSTDDTIDATRRALEFFEGAPETIVPDKLKAVVIRRPRKNEPVLNQKYLYFADHYSIRITPARVRKAKDKASVENSVGYFQRALKSRLRKRPLLTLANLNKEISELVIELNNRPMKRGGETRHERFLRLDKPLLQPLPSEPYAAWGLPKSKVLPPNYHITYDNVHYSAPSHLIGKLVSYRSSPKVVEIYHDGLLVVVHERRFEKYSFVTLDEHRPENHRYYISKSFNDWVESLPIYIRKIVLAERNKNDKKGNKDRLMLRVRKLIRDYSRDRVNAACKSAISSGFVELNYVKNLLVNGREELPETQIIEIKKFLPKENLRGRDYFDRDLNSKGENS